MYYLKLFNKTLLRFDIDKELNVSNIKICNDDIKLFPENLKEVNNEEITLSYRVKTRTKEVIIKISNINKAKLTVKV